MSKNQKNPWFDPIEFAYAKNYDELTAAQELFELKRDEIALNFITRLKAHFEQAAIRVLDVDEDEEGSPYVYADGKYQSQVARKKDSLVSGVGFFFDRPTGSGSKPFGFYTFVSFKISQSNFKRFSATALSKITESCLGRPLLGSSSEGPWQFMEIHYCDPNDAAAFTIEKCEKALVELVSVYRVLDRYMADEYARVVEADK